MAAQAHIAHRTPERLRIRIPGKKGDAAYFQSLEKLCGTISGIRSAEANPLTGSLLFILEPGAEPPLAEIARKLDIRLRPGAGATPQRIAADQMGRINKEVKNFTGGELDLNSIAFLCCLGLGIYQISMGNLVAPAWYVAFWYALSLPPGDLTGGK